VNHPIRGMKESLDGRSRKQEWDGPTTYPQVSIFFLGSLEKSSFPKYLTLTRMFIYGMV
jgi:hypothetical protein